MNRAHDDFEEYRKAKLAAIKYVSSKRRCTKEVREKLLDKGFEGGIIDAAIEELAEAGYLDDAEYARRFILDRIKFNPKSKRFIMMELKNKGIELDTIEEVFQNIEFDEKSIISALIDKKFGKYDARDEKVKRKIRSFLAYRGFRG